MPDITEAITEAITETVARLCVQTNMELPASISERIVKASKEEKSPLCAEVLNDLIENAKEARNLGVPICQDTGMAVVFVEIGDGVNFNGDLDKAINQGVAKGYKDGYLRKSIVSDPLFNRVNTEDNTPAIIHYSLSSKAELRNKIRVTVAPKGFGSENMSAIKMFNPSATPDDVVNFAVDVVSKAGSAPCPPIIVGMGIGGNFEYAAFLAKKALCRDVDVRNPDKNYAELEEKTLTAINRLGIGAQGFGGTVTALAVNIESFPTHIAGLPVAVNIGCHVTRHKSAVIELE